MRCTRCEGWMTTHELMDLSDSTEMVCAAWRCINCGEIVDPLLAENRARPQHATVTRSKRRWTGVLAA